MQRSTGPVSPAGYYIKDAETKAGVGSCVKISSSSVRGGDILFDCGMYDERLTTSANFVFISHGHIDHVGGCIAHARAKKMSERVNPSYYVPENTVALLESVRVSSSALNGQDIEMNIVPIPIGHSVFLSEYLSVKAFKTIHRVESQGYAIFSHSPSSSNRSSKVSNHSNSNSNSNSNSSGGGSKGSNSNNNNSNNSNSNSNDSNNSSNSNSSSKNNSSSNNNSSSSNNNSGSKNNDNGGQLEIVYTGDTVFSALVDLDPSELDVFNAPILIIEVTYLDGDYQKAVDRGHVHLDDIITNQELFKNQSIVFVHLSQKYFPFSKALTILKEKLEDTSLYDRCWVNLKSFGSSDYLTKVDSVNHNKLKRDVGWGWAAEKKATPNQEYSFSPHGHYDQGGGSDMQKTRYFSASVGGSSSNRSSNSVSSSSGRQITLSNNNNNNNKNNSSSSRESFHSSSSSSLNAPPAPPRPPFALPKSAYEEDRGADQSTSSGRARPFGNYKAKPCKFWDFGNCKQGTNCSYSHLP